MFRINKNRVALTYSQCPLDKTTIIDALQSLSLKPDKIIVAQEHHQDGSLHAHVYLERSGKFSTRNERYFDVLEYHPNIKSDYTGEHGKRYPVDEGWIQYLLKEDDSPEFIGWDNINDIKF